jgi:cytochrome c-type biogenesis protein CcmH/NrfG
MALNDFDVEIAALRRQAQVNPADAEAWRRLSDACALAGRLTYAVAAYRQVVRLRPVAGEWRSADHAR